MDRKRKWKIKEIVPQTEMKAIVSNSRTRDMSIREGRDYLCIM